MLRGPQHADVAAACQQPRRRDECARVRAAGARVLTLDQMEGLKDARMDCWGTEEDDDGDPPRCAPSVVFVPPGS